MQTVCHELFKLSLVTPGVTTFLDLGSGAGFPSFHFSSFFRCLAVGIEVDYPLYFTSLGNLKKIYLKARELGYYCPQVAFLHRDIFGMSSFNPFEIIYSFDKLFEPELLRHIARVFNNSTQVKVYISYQKPLNLQRAGFVDITLQRKLQLKMKGSRESKVCYIYTRRSTGPRRNDSPDPILGEILLRHSNGTLIEANDALDIHSLGTRMSTRSSGQL